MATDHTMDRPPIRIYRKGRYTYYRVDRGPHYEPRFKNFTDPAQADDHADMIWTMRRREGQQAAEITLEERSEAIRAINILHGAATLTEAAEYYMTTHRGSGSNPLLTEALEEYIRAKSAANRRPETIREIKYKAKRFVDSMPGLRTKEVSLDRCVEFIECIPSASRTQYKRVCGAFMSWCCKASRRYADVNPFVDIETPAPELSYAEIHTIEQVRTNLYWAEEHAPQLVIYLLLGYFCGLRGNEARCVTYGDIDIFSKKVRVDPEVAKRRRQRYVDIPDNAIEWLRLAVWGLKDQRVYYSRRAMRNMLKQSGAVVGHSTLRHCHGSYLLAKTKNAAYVAQQLGHDVATLYRHYRNGMVTDADAEAYYSILPSVLASSCSSRETGIRRIGVAG